ncbi:MAG: hypothetical protein HKO68_04825 [Desulfobacterales bacterium]|nr:hypothetical protein [Desulfobacterales bacterium]
MEAVCQEFNCQVEQILRKGAKKRRHAMWRSILPGIWAEKAAVDLGKYVGNICGAAVTVRHKHISTQISRKTAG